MLDIRLGSDVQYGVFAYAELVTAVSLALRLKSLLRQLPPNSTHSLLQET